MAPILDRPHGVALIVHGMWMRVLRDLPGNANSVS